MLIFFAIIMALLAAVVLLAAFAPVRVQARVRVRGLNAWASVSVETLFGLFRPRVAAAFLYGARGPLRVSLPGFLSDLRVDKKTGEVIVKKRASVPPRLVQSLMLGVLRQLRLEALSLHSRVGVRDDAAMTALFTGMFYAVLSPPCAALHARFPRARIALDAAPRYDGAYVDIKGHCIIRVHLAHIIGASLKAFLHYYKGALRPWHIPSKA